MQVQTDSVSPSDDATGYHVLVGYRDDSVHPLEGPMWSVLASADLAFCATAVFAWHHPIRFGLGTSK